MTPGPPAFGTPIEAAGTTPAASAHFPGGPLAIVGASARAAAFSAIRAGFEPSTADLFADRDLRAVARVARRVEVADYPDGLVEAARSLLPGPWIYTGALENRPDLIGRIAADRPLWGNGAAVVAPVRDPIALAGFLRDRGFQPPGARVDPAGLPRDRSWLRKPIATASGRGIVAWDDRAAPSSEPCWYQERIAGPSYGALFVGGIERAGLIGVALQRVGRPGRPFAYVGSVGPWPIGPDVRAELADLGNALATDRGLRGLFGVDFAIDGGRIRPLEVNPRYTASVEVHELAHRRSAIAEHAAVCRGELRRPDDWPAVVPRTVGKAIVFADRAIAWGGAAPIATVAEPRPGRFDPVDGLADLPAQGQWIGAGDPVLTILVERAGPWEANDALSRELDGWRGRLAAMATDRPAAASDCVQLVGASFGGGSSVGRVWR